MRFVQRQFGGHHLHIWRIRDRKPADRSTLLDPDTYELHDVEWTSELGRLSWTYRGETYTNQYLPPMLHNQECPPELLIREMDYAGVDMAVLHPAPIFGVTNDYQLDAVRRFPDRFVTLFNLPEATVLNDPDRAIAEIERLVGSGGRCGVQFFSRWYYGAGAESPWDGGPMRPYWDAVVGLNVPVYFTLYNGGKRAREFDSLAHVSATVCWGRTRNRDCILYPGKGTVVLIRPAQTFYERIITASDGSKIDSAATTRR